MFWPSKMRHTAYIWVYCLAAICSPRICAAAGGTIVQMGDSFASFSGYSLATFCKGQKVENLGIGGTTTDDWTDDLIKEKLGELEGNSFEQLMLAIGGNDYLNSKCTLSKNILMQRVRDTIDRFLAIANPAEGLVLLGYCKPTKDFEECDTFAVKTLNQALAQAVNGRNAVFVDTAGACGGGSKKYMVDAIHPNNRGYCTLYQNEAAQTAFGCECQDKVDCSTVSKNVPDSPPRATLPYTPCGTKPPTPVETKSPVSQCSDDAKKKFKIGKKVFLCSDLKKNQCKKWDKRNGNLVSNYCLQLCNNCNKKKRCKDDKMNLIDPDSGEKFKCKDIPKEYCDIKDKKKRLVSQYCRKLCGFCKS
mmetsp:Transcript_41153/g.80554  ORF Transcript_41153/g.80554 Transcript_41153/m.80554 type:complete len:361 (+) Transcript_41153:386-1468(+)